MEGGGGSSVCEREKRRKGSTWEHQPQRRDDGERESEIKRER